MVAVLDERMVLMSAIVLGVVLAKHFSLMLVSPSLQEMVSIIFTVDVTTVFGALLSVQLQSMVEMNTVVSTVLIAGFAA